MFEGFMLVLGSWSSSPTLPPILPPCKYLLLHLCLSFKIPPHTLVWTFPSSHFIPPSKVNSPNFFFLALRLFCKFDKWLQPKMMLILDKIGILTSVFWGNQNCFYISVKLLWVLKELCMHLFNIYVISWSLIRAWLDVQRPSPAMD